jgi:hypothetical protein
MTDSTRKAAVEAYFDGFRGSNHDAILRLLTDDVVWDLPGFKHLEGKDAFDGEIENEEFTGRVRRSSPPSVQAYALSDSPTDTRSVTTPPSRTRMRSPLIGSANQIAPSASRQMPSGMAPSTRAYSRRSCSVPSSAIRNAVSPPPALSPTMKVAPSGVITEPFGNAIPSAATRTVPSGSTNAMAASRASARFSKSNPKLPT